MGTHKTGLIPPSRILILIVPRRYFCCGFLLILVLALCIYTLVTYFVNLGNRMTTCLGKSCSFGLPRVPFVNCCQFMYLVIYLLVLRAGCGISLYQYLIIAYLFTFLYPENTDKLFSVQFFPLNRSEMTKAIVVDS